MTLFSTQNFHNIFDEKAEAESDSIDKPMMEFLLKKISCILKSEYETIGEISESRLFSHPTGGECRFFRESINGAAKYHTDSTRYVYERALQ